MAAKVEQRGTVPDKTDLCLQCDGAGGCESDCTAGQECCGISCITECDTDLCLKCDGAGGCESDCTAGQECCGGTCITECEADNCESCNEGSCEDWCALGLHCDGNGKCVCWEDSDCGLDECCVDDDCVSCCIPDGGGDDCTYTFDPPPSLCEFVGIADHTCLYEGAHCYWRILDGPAPDAGKRCSCGYTFDEVPCVTAYPQTCQTSIGLPYMCRCKDKQGLVNYGYFGTRDACQQ